MGWKELQSNQVFISSGEVESKRFGFHILNVLCGARSQSGENILKQALLFEEFEIAVVRYPLQLTEIGNLLSKIENNVIHANPTEYWGVSIRDQAPKTAPSNVNVQRVETNDLKVIERIVKSSFAGYRSHWHDNQRTQAIRMEDAYNEWVRNKITSTESRCYIMYLDGEPGGFALAENKDKVGEILLAGISKEFQSRGLYQYLLAHIEMEMREDKLEELVISTQRRNGNVQKAWERYGLLPLLTVCTVHVENQKT